MAMAKIFSPDAVIVTPCTLLGLGEQAGQLNRVVFLPAGTALKAPQSVLLKETTAQLAAYFADAGFCFNLPLAAAASVFQRQVRQQLLQIGVGERKTYGELAKNLASAPRAIGQACRFNPLPVIIPCHRVVAAKAVGGFNGQREGASLDIKYYLLKHEAVGS